MPGPGDQEIRRSGGQGIESSHLYNHPGPNYLNSIKSMNMHQSQTISMDGNLSDNFSCNPPAQVTSGTLLLLSPFHATIATCDQSSNVYSHYAWSLLYPQVLPSGPLYSGYPCMPSFSGLMSMMTSSWPLHLKS